MKALRICLCAALSFALLTGCAKAPSEVDKEIENYTHHAHTWQDLMNDILMDYKIFP